MKRMYRSIVGLIGVFKYNLHDAKKYFLSTSSFGNEGKLIKLTHSMEKRISFENRDPSFGKAKAFQLIDLVEKELNKGKISKTIINWSVTTLEMYAQTFMEKSEKDNLLKRLSKTSAPLKDLSNAEETQGGVFELSRDQILSASKGDFNTFSKSRHSIRDFEHPADVLIVKKALLLAQKCPSTCNIQPVQAYLVQDKKVLKDLLSLQRGNKGFTDKIPQLLVLTADLSLYSGFRERNQCYIDGGIFALSASYALHFYGIGSCFLNWASSKKEDEEIHKLLNIPKEQVVVVLLAIGLLPQNVCIPVSRRRQVDEIFKLV